MAIHTILQLPDPRLRLVAKEVEGVTPEIVQLVDDLIETMYHNDGAGLAATQINVQLRIYVLDISRRGNEPLHFINPKIIHAEGNKTYKEGCLSVPGIYVTVPRAAKVTIQALNKKGETFEMTADSDILAQGLQHEMDHLDGKVFTDYLSPLKQQRAMRKMAKIQKRMAA